MYYHVSPDKQTLADLEKYLTTIELRTARQVAASCLTTLARKGRAAAIRNLPARVDLPRAEVRKRLRVFRANPKHGTRMTAGIIASAYDIREILLDPRQTGHPGRPRKSATDAARAARKRRKAKGAKPPRAGGVKSKGRQYPGAWIGSRQRGGGRANVIKRTGGPKSKPRVVMRPWGRISQNYLTRAMPVISRAWPELFSERMKKALRKRGQVTAEQFLTDQGVI